MKIAELAIQKKVVSWAFVVLLIVGGIVAFENLGRLEDPEYTIKDALVTTYYPGASAQEVEEEVTETLETAIQQLSQLKRITSISKPGVSIITVTIQDKFGKKALPQVWDELRRKVGDVQSKLPPGVSKAIVADDFGDVYGILLAIHGKGFSFEEIEDYADFVKRELLLVKDVAKIEIYGIQKQQVHVEIARDRLAQLGISLQSIYGTLARQNLISPSGNVRVSDDYIRIDPSGDFKKVEEIGNLALRGSNPSDIIYLKDIAKITHGYETPPSTIVRFNGEPTYVIGVSIASGGNVVNMGEAIKEKLASLKNQTPLGLEIGVITFQSDNVTASIDNFMISLVEALAIVLVVLMIFMGLRSGMIIGSILLLTVLGTFIGMSLWGINLERISLGALIIALGMLVDNAIVVTEGILVKVQRGFDRIESAKEVVAQNAFPLLGATVIAILAFAAIGLSQDNTGEYTRSLFQVILISLLLSWLLAITITPLFCVTFFKVDKSSEQGEVDPYKGSIFKLYRGFLLLCLRVRWLTVGVMLGLLVLAVFVFGLLENSFFPESTRNQFMVHYWLPEGADIRTTSADMKKFSEHIRTLKGVEAVSEFVGAGAPRFVLTYSPEKQYRAYGILLVNVKNYEVIETLMPKVDKYAQDNFLDAIVTIKKFVLGPGKENTLESRFSGPNPDVLRELADKTKNILREDGGAVGIKDDWRERILVIRPEFAETQARQLGITKSAVDDVLAMTFSGKDVGVFRKRDKLLPILSRAPKEERDNVSNIQDVQIWSPIAQATVPLRQVIDEFKTSWEDGVIHRRNRRRTITVQANQKSGNASVVFARIQPKVEAIKLPIGYDHEWGGEYEDSRDAQVALFESIPGTITLMLIVLIMLFNAIRQTTIIILTVPLAIIGVSIGLLATGQSFGFMALLGFLSLVGMLIKNAIVLIDSIDIEIREGKEPFHAIVDASVSRMRPVSMAAVTTVLGMIPLLFDVFFVGMAVTIMAGLTFATVLTLIFVPVLYAILFRVPYETL